MKKRCCYCKIVFGDNLKSPPNLPPGAVSDGICPACTPRANAEVDALLAKQGITDSMIEERVEVLLIYMDLLEEAEKYEE